MKKYAISQVCEINPPKTIELSDTSLISFVPMECVSIDGHMELDKTIDVNRAKNYTVFKNGDVLFAKITPCMENGKGAVANGLLNGFGAGSTEFIVLRPKKEIINSRWLYLFLSQKQFRMECQQHMTGSAGQKRVPPKYLASCEIPIPPLPEQKRIVALIDELFSQLDAGVEMLKKTKTQLAVYRQAVLKEAFSGFTEKAPIRKISSIVTSGSRGWAHYYTEKGARFIRITDLTRDRIILKNDNPQFVFLPDDAEGRRTHLQPHDVLVSITADLGSIALIPNDIGEAYVNQHIAMVRFLNPKQAEFMAWYLKSDYGQKELLKNKRGAGKLGLGLDDIRDTTVPIVSDDVASVVVKSIDAKLSICESIENSILQCFQQLQALRQSILKQAFEGGL